MYYKPKITYNLEESNYTTTTDDGKFYFSSIVLKDKFDRERKQHKEYLMHQCKLRVGIQLKFETDLTYDLLSYIKIEHRGFLVDTKKYGRLEVKEDIEMVDEINSVTVV